MADTKDATLVDDLAFADVPAVDSIEYAGMPVVPLPGMVLLPHMLAGVRVSDPRAVAAIEAALADAGLVVVAPGPANGGVDAAEDLPKAIYDDEGKPALVGNIGVVARVEQSTAGDDNTRHVAMHALHRVVIMALHGGPDYVTADSEPRLDPELPVPLEPEAGDLMAQALVILEEVVELMPGLPSGVLDFIRKIDQPGQLADHTGYFPEYEFEERLAILSELEPVARLTATTQALKRHLARLQLRAQIMMEVKAELDGTQREAFLREQLRVIRRELGEDTTEGWIDEVRSRLDQAELPEIVRNRVGREFDRLARLGPHAPEASVVQNYLEWMADLPWTTETTDTIDLAAAARMLDEDHYGLEKVKERILEYLAVRRLAGDRLKTPIICFVGPPGVGKTSLGRTIARVIGRNFVRVSLGGLHDEAEVRGHRRTYIGAMPGRIIQGMRDARTRNPVFMLDEIDKVGRDFRGDPTAALLEALDPEQNSAFSDHYIEVPFDLSHTIFITTANTLEPIPPPLRDRMEVISLAGYTEEEKLSIAQGFLVPRQLTSHGLGESDVCFRKDALVRLIREYTHEAGVRNLERSIGSVARKVARRLVEGRRPKAGRFVVRAADVPGYLGPPQYEVGAKLLEDQVGVATGVAVTEAGGDVLPVEVSVIEGSGQLLLTGQLGDVMKESAQAALTYARSRIGNMGIEHGHLEKQDVHIHVPAGAVPKDGPSAGIAMATALLSALSGRAVRSDVAMTGEVTLRGRVLPIGGLKEKVLAAKAAGITEFILPASNEKDLPELSPSARKGIKLIPVNHMDQVVNVALLPIAEERITTSPSAI